MSRKQCARKPRPVYANPLIVARNQATRLTAAERATIMTPLRAAFDRLRQGAASDTDWCVLAGCVHLAQNIERQGVVRGLDAHLKEADQALCEVEARASASGRWRSPTLHFYELDALRLFVDDLFDFQLRQLSYAEYRRVYTTTEGQARSRGAVVVKMGEVSHEE